MKRSINTSLLLLFVCFCWAAASAPPRLYAGSKINVTASILPQKYFTEKIGGKRVTVSVMVLPGANPATYEPKPRQMVNLAQARIYFAIGVPFENNWLSKFAATNPNMAIVPTQSGIAKIPMKAGRHGHHAAAHGHEMTSGPKDPHIWLSPPLVMVQAKNILQALVKADPEGRMVYESNYKAFLHELKSLDMEIRRIFQTEAPTIRFMVYHPSWGYFAKTYGLEQIPIELEGKKPSPRKLMELIEEARKDGIRVIFVQPQFSEKSAQTIARAIGGKVVFANPLAEDWGENLLRVAKKIKSAF